MIIRADPENIQLQNQKLSQLKNRMFLNQDFSDNHVGKADR